VSLRRRFDASRFETRVQLRSAFALAVLAREQLETAAVVREFTDTTVRRAAVRVAAGEISPLRLRMAEVAAAQAVQAEREAARAYRAACRDLATRAGWPVDEVIEPVGELAAPVVPGDTDALVESALGEHPELVALAKELDAAQAASQAARREAWPEPSLGGYVAREHPPGTAFPDYVGLVTISVPLPLWRRNQDARARAEAAVRIATTELSTRRYELAQRIVRMADAVGTAAVRVRGYAHEVLPRFEENLDLLQRSFELGEIDILEVAVGRQAFFEAQQAAFDTWRDYLEALRELELAVGHEIAPATDR
jgi:cobalt-zinc-cadmium efflux system outer membrane protein